MHPEKAELELYVIGAVDRSRTDAIERHFVDCEDCLREVIEQAKLEATLVELGAVVVPCPGCSRVGREIRCGQCGAARIAGGFRVEAVMVQSQHGRMYLARDDAGRKIALKELVFVHAPDARAVSSFEREASFLRALSHPGIPRFVASFQEGDGIDTRLYLAQEYIEGSSLQMLLAEHFFSEDEIVDIAIRALDILVYLQALSPMVTHRDIKPANLIRRPDGSISLVDFGAALDVGQTGVTTAVGTFGYMPVEQLAGIVDATTDVFALGASLLHLLTRREPWRFLDDVRAEKLNVSPPVRKLLHTMVARDVRHRFSGAAEALAVWRRLRRGAPRRFGRTATVAAIAATALIAGGAGTYGVTRWTEPSGSPAPVVAVSVPNDRVTDDDEPREHAWDVPDTGIPACDELVRVFLSCDQVPQQARDAFVEAARQWRHALEVGGAAAREAMEQSCAEVVASSDDALRAMGCGSPPPPRIVGEQAETTRPVFAIAGFDDERVTFRYRAGDKLPPAPGSGGIVWFDGDRAPSQFGRGDPDVQLIRAEGHIHVQSSDPGAAIVGLGRGELAQFDRLDPKKLDYQPIGKLELESGNVYLLRLPRTDRHVLFELEIDDPRRHLREKLERDRRQIREPERDEIGDFPPHHRG